jgi:hypothetical protein
MTAAKSSFQLAGGAAAILLCAAGLLFGQATPVNRPAQPQGPIEIPPAPAPAVRQPVQNCPPLANRYMRANKLIEAEVTGLLSSSHLKPGKEVWVSSVFEETDPECRMDAKAAIYGRITAASSSKNPNASELSLVFDHADCAGHARQEMKLILIGVVGPPDESDTVRNALPSKGLDSGWGSDQKTNPGGPPQFVKPGEVMGMKKVKLDPQGGPACSARLTSSDRNLELGPGTVLLLAEPDAK